MKCYLIRTMVCLAWAYYFILEEAIRKCWNFVECHMLIKTMHKSLFAPLNVPMILAIGNRPSTKERRHHVPSTSLFLTDGSQFSLRYPSRRAVSSPRRPVQRSCSLLRRFSDPVTVITGARADRFRPVPEQFVELAETQAKEILGFVEHPARTPTSNAPRFRLTNDISAGVSSRRRPSPVA